MENLLFDQNPRCKQAKKVEMADYEQLENDYYEVDHRYTLLSQSVDILLNVTRKLDRELNKLESYRIQRGFSATIRRNSGNPRTGASSHSS